MMSTKKEFLTMWWRMLDLRSPPIFIFRVLESYNYPGRSWFQNCLNQEFIGQNFKFEVPENGLQKSIIYVFVMKKMQKKNS